MIEVFDEFANICLRVSSLKFGCSFVFLAGEVTAFASIGVVRKKKVEDNTKIIAKNWCQTRK